MLRDERQRRSKALRKPSNVSAITLIKPDDPLEYSKPDRVWPSDDDGDLSDFHYVLVMMMIRYSIWPSVPNIEIRH